MIVSDGIPRNTQVTTGTVRIAGTHRLRQIHIGSLAASLHHTIHAIHAHRIKRIRLKFGSTNNGTLREQHTQLVRLHRFGKTNLIAFTLHRGIRLAGGKLHILPIAILIRILQLPQLDHRHTATVSPEEQLRLLQRNSAIPGKLQPRLGTGIVTPIIPSLIRSIGIQHLTVDNLLGIVLRLIWIGEAGARSGL